MEPPRRRPWAALRLASTDVPTVTGLDDRTQVVWDRLRHELAWFDGAARRARIGYLALRLATVGAAFLVAVQAPLGLSGTVTALLGAAIVAAETLQQVFHFQVNWMSYRLAAETLRDHGYLFASGSAPYDVDATRTNLLAQQVSAMTREVNAAWAARLRQAQAPGPQAPAAEA